MLKPDTLLKIFMCESMAVIALTISHSLNRQKEQKKKYLKIFKQVLNLIPGFRAKAESEGNKDSFQLLLDMVSACMCIYAHISIQFTSP